MAVNPNEFKKDALLLYYHNGMWEQAEVGGVYQAWSTLELKNVEVIVAEPCSYCGCLDKTGLTSPTDGVE